MEITGAPTALEVGLDSHALGNERPDSNNSEEIQAVGLTRVAALPPLPPGLPGSDEHWQRKDRRLK